MRTKISNWMANIGLFLFSTTLVLLVAEIGVRFLIPMQVDERTLMFSSHTFQLDQNGAVRYQPNKNIRTIAVYDNKIEYDVHFDTNNLGLADGKNYEYENLANKRYYAFVGDSFTAGFHGGEPWVPKLRRNIDGENIEIFNLGVSGTGIEHFYRLLQGTSEQLHITHIVILAISEDIRRNSWYPLTNSTEIRFCQKNTPSPECIKRPYIAKIIHPASSSEDILKVAEEIIKDREKNPQRSGITGFLRQSELLVFVVRSLKTMLLYEERYSLDALRNIREAFPLAEIYFMHLPQKQEVANGGYFLNNLGNEIEEIGISYFPALKECHWQMDMFFVHDSHPNSVGYDNIRKCVSSYIFR